MSDATLARMEHGKYVGVRGEPRRDGVCVIRKPTLYIYYVVCIHLQGAGMKMSTSRGSVSLIACSATCCCSASSMCVASDDLQASQAKVDSTCDKHHLSCVNEKGVAHGCGASQMPTRRRYRADTLAKIAVSIAELMSVPPDVPRGWWKE